ncbi:MAG: hypothetical protein ACI3ZL_00070 [Candidatus Cryptobacteroides sp.]
MDNRWTEQFKDKMQDYQEMAPEGLWNAVSDAVVVTERKRGTVVLLRSLAGAAAAAAIVLGLIYFTDTEDIEYRDMVVQVEEIPSPEVTMADDDLHIASNAIAVADKPETIVMPVRTSDLDSGKGAPTYTEPSSEEKSSTDIVTPSEEDMGGSSGYDTETSHTDTGNNHSTIPATSENDFSFPETGIRSSGKDRIISLSASCSGGLGNMTSIPGYSGSVAAATISSFGSNPENEIRVFNRTREVTSETSYRQPVNIGIKVSGYVSQRWSISTGLEWTWLHSTIREGSETYYISRIYDLHYIGLPLTVNCDLWKGYGLKVYAGAGGAVQKCFSGRQIEEYVYNSVPGNSESSKLIEKPLQWSVRAEAGLEYDFAPFAGIYAEPGMTWHFNNGSPVDNIYKSRPFNFSLSIGIRFNFR